MLDCLMHRLFVALRPPLAVRQALLAAVGGVPGARWQDDEQLHLTMRFIGEVDRHRAEDVAIALTGVRSPPVPLAIEGTGAFDRRGRVHTLWARVPANAELVRLQAGVEQALVRAGLPPEHRAFRPHITLARLAAGRNVVEPWLERTCALATAEVALDSLLLFESVLGGTGASYQVIARYPLAS